VLVAVLIATRCGCYQGAEVRLWLTSITTAAVKANVGNGTAASGSRCLTPFLRTVCALASVGNFRLALSYPTSLISASLIYFCLIADVAHWLPFISFYCLTFH